MTVTRISFIVPVLNDARRLAVCLQSIRRNLSAQGTVEIIVVDNGSSDGSPDVALRYGATVISAQGRVSELRNLGARRATGDVLAFVDADHEIGLGWVFAARDVLRLPGVGAAGALYRPPLDGTWVQQAYGHLRGRSTGQHDTDWLGSGNLAVWRHVFEAIGGFDTSLEACEDVDLCQRIRAAGHRLVSDARLDTIHHGDPETLRDVFRSELWRGRNNLRVSFRGPLSLRALPSALIPVVDMLAIATAVAGILLFASGRPSGLVVALASAAVIVLGASAKVARSQRRRAAAGLARLLQTFIVACVYDFARALALLARAPHRRDASRQAPVTAA